MMKKVFKIIGILFWIFMLFNVITWKQESFEYRELAGSMLNKAEITQEDLSKGNDYKTATEIGTVEAGDYYYKVRKLSGPEHLGQLKLSENEGANITCTHGDAKILIIDEQGQQRFYAAVTELYVEPGGAGAYDVYLIGKKFTGEVTIRLLERGSNLSAGMFVKDHEAVKKAFEVGVGNHAEFEVGAKYTPGMPGPLKAVGRVKSLHDGSFRQEGPAGKGFPCNVGLSAVISFGNIDVMVCEDPGASGDPQILRHFGIEPKLYDLIVVKANTSFKVPYSKFADEFCYADTPGAGASNLNFFEWTNRPERFYPFDSLDEFVIEEPKIWRK